LSNTQSSKNALTHGFYASDVVLAGESQQEFDDLLQAYRDEYCPDGVSEEAAVVELASLHWKKRRLEAGLRQALQKQRDYSTVADTSSDGWNIVADGARAVAKPQTAAVQRICEMIWKYVERVGKPDESKADSQAVSQAVELDKLTVLAKELNLVSQNLIIPLLHAAEKEKLDQIERAYLPDIMEKELKIQAEIDRRIDRVLKRLVMTKEFKRLYRAKSVNAKQVEATRLTAQ
jgi:hypothetical protein